MPSSEAKLKRVVIDPDTAIRIASGALTPSAAIALLAPTLLRSEVLATLFARVRDGALSADEGLAINARFAKLKVRYLGDAVLRRRAWAIAERQGLSTTALAEYVALVQLQADALVTEDPDLTAAAKGEVRVVAPRTIAAN